MIDFCVLSQKQLIGSSLMKIPDLCCFDKQGESGSKNCGLGEQGSLIAGLQLISMQKCRTPLAAAVRLY